MVNALARAMFAVASNQRLSVLIYHRIPADSDALLVDEPQAVDFERTMHWIKSTFNVIPLADGVDGLKTGKLPTRALAITFDDGYANNATVAAPILKNLGMHATFFIATGFLDGGRMFNDTIVEAVRGCREETLDLSSLRLGRHPLKTIEQRRVAIECILAGIKYSPEAERTELAERVADIADVKPPDDLMMTSEQAARLAQDGFELGGHTVTHPILAQLDTEAAREEIARGRERVDELSGKRTRLFAYPNGKPQRDYVVASSELVRELGFDGAVSTSHGVARVGSNPYEIPRFTPWISTPLRFSAQLLKNITSTTPVYVRQ